MTATKRPIPQSAVALRKESVDRNNDVVELLRKYTRSLSARRAWIEMLKLQGNTQYEAVALRKESVDRNYTPL